MQENPSKVNLIYVTENVLFNIFDVSQSDALTLCTGQSYLTWRGSLQGCRWRWVDFEGRCCLRLAPPRLWSRRYRAPWPPRRKLPAELTNPSRPWRYHSGAGWSETSGWLLPCTLESEVSDRTCSGWETRGMGGQQVSKEASYMIRNYIVKNTSIWCRTAVIQVKQKKNISIKFKKT